MRKLLSHVLSFCMICCSSSVLASQLEDEGRVNVGLESSPLARELDEKMMSAIVGSGNVDVEMADYQQSDMSVEAVITNRSILSLKYEMNLITTSGEIVETLAVGRVSQNETLTVAGTPQSTGNVQDQLVQVRTFSGIKSLTAVNSIKSPTSIDTDGDGLSDAFEISVGLNANNSEDAHQDLDGDGLSNIVEILDYFTDFNNPDTDGDSIKDGDEVTYGLDPNDNGDADLDLDRDFVTNADEINIHNTNPNEYSEGIAPDTDGDGVNDIVELALGLDVNDHGVSDVGGNSALEKQKLHLLNRLTFGPTKKALDDISAMGIEGWLANEMNMLDYDTLVADPDSDPAQRLRVDNMTQFDNPGRVGAIRPVHSTKQLQSKMALFWDNHFSTYIVKTQKALPELQEEDEFFVNALGNFRNLLHVSAKSYPMLVYLDLIASHKDGPNENYAREVMELHTLGATLSDLDDSGQPFYTAGDIDSLSRMLTGWRSSNGEPPLSLYKRRGGSAIIQGNQRKFKFYSGPHDVDAKVFLDTAYPENGGVEEGEQALDVLAYHERTAWFICNKLAKFIVSDEPSPATVNDCKINFMVNKTAPDQIAKALQVLLSSNEFTDTENQRAKFKDNQEYMFALARFMNVQAIGTLVTVNDPIFAGMLFLGATAFGEAVEKTGQGLFLKAPPTGYKEEPDEWITGNAAISRFREGNEIIFGNNTVRNLTDYFSSQNLTTSKQILGHVFKLMLGGHYGNREMEMGYWVLHPNNEVFDLNAVNTENKLKNLIARVAQLPEHNLH